MNRKIKFRAWDKERNKMLYDAKPYIEDEKRKTYLEDMKEKFPDVKLKTDGAPVVCRENLYLEMFPGCRKGLSCVKCWNQEMED